MKELQPLNDNVILCLLYTSSLYTSQKINAPIAKNIRNWIAFFKTLFKIYLFV